MEEWEEKGRQGWARNWQVRESEKER